MYNFCTLFNSVYLSRALAMHTSLQKTGCNFHLYIFAFDEIAYSALQKLGLKNVTTISLQEFEDDELKKLKQDRTAGEYCWTCTPATIAYCIEKFHLDQCTYIDADLYFFEDPSVLILEMQKHDVLITSHRYTPIYDQSEIYGKYCVQFITFKNTERGTKVLKWWKDACMEWCYNRVEDGKFGDQKYLDNWMSMFEGIYELEHLGGGVAPWNIQQYDLNLVNGRIFLDNLSTRERIELIFYHFHNLKYVEGPGFHLGHYEINKKAISFIYQPYIKALQETELQLRNAYPGYTFHEKAGIPKINKYWWRRMLYKYKGRYKNYLKTDYLLRYGSND